MDEAERRQRWAETAVRRELEAIEALPVEVNIQKPNNAYWRSLFAIAGIVNGGYLPKEETFALIVQASQHLNLLEKAMAYQWNRACQRARPRHPRSL